MNPRATLLLFALAAPLTAAETQTEADEYTRYELLRPGTARFRIRYEVSATTPDATRYFNPIRKGSAASDEAVYDRRTGRALPFSIVSGSEAKAAGFAEAELDTSYIRVELPRPVPEGGELRLLIDKTYHDPTSYFEERHDVVFSRTLSIKRNAVVLPDGYELIGCNVPAQVSGEADGRIVVSFMNPMPSDAPVVVRGRRLP